MISKSILARKYGEKVDGMVPYFEEGPKKAA